MKLFAGHRIKKSLNRPADRRWPYTTVVLAFELITCWTLVGCAGDSLHFTPTWFTTNESKISDNFSIPADNGITSILVTTSVSSLKKENVESRSDDRMSQWNSSSLAVTDSGSSTQTISSLPSATNVTSTIGADAGVSGQTADVAVGNETLASAAANSTVLTTLSSYTNDSFSSDTNSSVTVMLSTANFTTARMKVEEDKKFKYYSYRIINNDEESFDFYWRNEDEVFSRKHHEVLEKQYLTALTVKLNFTFPFYGHEVDSVTVATGGFLYMSDFLHDRLTYSQYIAPLMANFGTEFFNQSHIHYAGNGSSFTVWWENVTLKDFPSAGQFSFQLTLFGTGQIAFVYDFIPIPITKISSSFHAVRVGLSDAYYFDEVSSAGYTERKISEYNRVAVDSSRIGNHSLILVEPLPTCIQQKSCSACLTAASTLPFACQWCPQLKRCSDGLDRMRQQWLKYGCNTERVTALRGCSGNRVQLGFITIIVVVFAFLMAGGFWLCYAHTHPNSSSGRWLIEHRPSTCFGLFRKTSCFRSPARRERYVSYQSGLESFA